MSAVESDGYKIQGRQGERDEQQARGEGEIKVDGATAHARTTKLESLVNRLNGTRSLVLGRRDA